MGASPWVRAKIDRAHEPGWLAVDQDAVGSIIDGRSRALHPWKRYGCNPALRQCHLRLPG